MNKPITDFAGRSVYSQSHHWCTPPKYVEAVKKVFGGKISLDPCSNNESVVLAEKEFCLPYTDGLNSEWNYPTIYVNPPYGADRERRTTIRHWLAKCSITHKKYSSEIIALIPVATNTVHWKQYIFGEADGVCFLYDTRLKFLVNGSTDNKGAPMACAMVYWGSHFANFKKIFSDYGAVLSLVELKKEKIKKIKQDFLFREF